MNNQSHTLNLPVDMQARLYSCTLLCFFLIKCSQYSSLIRRQFSKWLTSSREISQRWQPFLFKCLCPDILRRVSGRMIIAVRSLSVFMMHWSYKKTVILWLASIVLFETYITDLLKNTHNIHTIACHWMKTMIQNLFSHCRVLSMLCYISPCYDETRLSLLY